MSKLSKNLLYLRKREGLSQEKLSEILGIKRARYSCYEQYRSEPNISIIIQISDYYKITIDDLIKIDLNPKSIKL